MNTAYDNCWAKECHQIWPKTRDISLLENNSNQLYKARMDRKREYVINKYNNIDI